MHIIRSLDFGGVESRMILLAQHAEESDFEHTFCAIHSGGAAFAKMKNSGANVTVLGEPASIPSIRALSSLTRHIRKYSPDIVHTHGAEANFHGLIASRFAKVPVTLGEEIGIPRHSPAARIAFRIVYGTADGVVAISNSVKNAIVTLQEANREDIHVVLNPARMLDTVTRRSSLKNANQSFRLGFAGRLEEVKNASSLLDAIAIVRDSGVQATLDIVGNGSQRALLEKQALALGLSKSVAFHGFMEDPFSTLGSCDLYIQPSLSEGFGIALVEAMSAGLATLATPVGGATEIIEHGINGLLLEDVDGQSIANGVIAAAALGRDELARIGQTARASVLSRFSPTNYIHSLDRLYDSTLTERRNRTGTAA
ncbi:glycosyltransferase [Luteimonas sp. FCS-9]|uniref:glycosyltransferase n=1 Tax=Luteimonas sp. FCS-9 TaxID=1547516 RepID=UPI0009E4A6C6|nr:glycosyltransferase [Luteimonas sp. FCS-9]